MTEDQAREKWCPFTSSDLIMNRENYSIGGNPTPATCIASECMAWRWDDNVTTGQLEGKDPWAEKPPTGYCGLAGKTMNRERAKELLSIITAFAEGKTIQCNHKQAEIVTWFDDDDPQFELDHLEFRKKPEPRQWWLDFRTGRFYGGTKGWDGDDEDFSDIDAIKVREVL